MGMLLQPWRATEEDCARVVALLERCRAAAIAAGVFDARAGAPSPCGPGVALSSSGSDVFHDAIHRAPVVARARATRPSTWAAAEQRSCQFNIPGAGVPQQQLQQRGARVHMRHVCSRAYVALHVVTVTVLHVQTPQCWATMSSLTVSEKMNAFDLT
jgi:hypothetical protein